MASSSTSFAHRRSSKYDVFLSFRGKDTRKNFVDHLYHALQRQEICTYKVDKRITKGKRICGELIRTIKDSKFYNIVFSRKYASLSWYLNELVKIMEYHNDKTTENTAFPVFYDVAPKEVSHQRRVVRKAFAKNKNKEAVGKWREALKEAIDLAGWELKNTADG
ncbi:toll/interleukin-1 receptor-like protein [Lactuca sativa]|nr:toll/interleukin-1 receptor-like protein [Lactuca sativa]